MTHDEALALQAKINTILEAARHEPKDKRTSMGAINWGDLRCVEIEERRSLLLPGDRWIVALIEEASPEALGLHRYVRMRLGRADVRIETAW
jgi:hypothetical protein